MDMQEIKGLNSNKEEVVVFVKMPGAKDFSKAKLAYNKAFREALEQGAILRAKLTDYVIEQGIWDAKKEAKQKSLLDKIRELELFLKTGGKKLKDAYNTAIELGKLRSELQSLVMEKNSYDSLCAEGLAQQANFDELILLCVLKADKVTKVWNNMDEYNNDSNEEWAVKAASKLASMLYGLDPDFEKNLPENKFLSQYKFVNENLELVNKDGHRVDVEGNLIDEEGYYVKYVDGKAVRITKDGKELDEDNRVKVEFTPFLDDDGNPVLPENV